MNLFADVVVVGGGVGGVCAALASARQGAKTLLLERAEQLGGTGVHSPVGLVCQFYDKSGRPVNTGIHRELFPQAYQWSGRFDDADLVPIYDENELKLRYRQLCAAEANLQVLTGADVVSVRREDARIRSLALRDGRLIEARIFIDSTADGNLSVLAGAGFRKGRENDGALMTATLTFKVQGIRPERLLRPDILTWSGIRSLRAELNLLYADVKNRTDNTNTRSGVLCFPGPDGRSLLFNSTAIQNVDPTQPGSVEAGRRIAEKQVQDLLEALLRHPALKDNERVEISPWMGIRESRRILGDHILTEAEVLGEARFVDMVAACAYGVDIHDPQGGPARYQEIPGSGYYHIPWRCLTARGFDNLLLGSRCISGDVTAHSSYRVMSGVSAIGQAAGCGAACALHQNQPVLRDLPAAFIRERLRASGQFVEP